MRLQCTREAINIQFKALPSTGVGQRQSFRCQVLHKTLQEVGRSRIDSTEYDVLLLLLEHGSNVVV